MDDVMDDWPTVTIYCEGPPDNQGNFTHERYVIIPYTRVELPNPVPFDLVDKGDSRPGQTKWLPSPQWTDADGRIRRARLHTHDRFVDGVQALQKARGTRSPRHTNHLPTGPDGKLARPRGQLRFFCEVCGFDEQRNDAADALARVLDKLVANNHLEIAARNLIKYLPS
jgi:hypothetical protein